MVLRSPRIIFYYLLVPAILIIFVYSFMFAKFSSLSHLPESYHPTSLQSDLEGEYSNVATTRTVFSNRSGRSEAINTLEEYPRLDLNPNDTSFWSPKLEAQYAETQSQGVFPLKVIIVPHSHNDPGWLNTYDQYFYRYTYYILDNMVKNLARYPKMTFLWSEMSFFSRWWDRLPSDVERNALRRLLAESRLEIVTGGWVMTDEGPAHYWDQLDQLIEGHQFLRSALNYTPVNSWSIDPFGHSGTFPYLLGKAGLSGMYIQRTHFAWKRHLAERQNLEFLWKPFFESGSSNQQQQNPLLCHMSPLDLYSFKYACGPEPKKCLDFDFRKIFGESSESTATQLNSTNIEAKTREILEQYRKLGSLFPHNIALVLLGDDFRYNFDIEWQQQYENYNKLMTYVNGNGAKFAGAKIQFGTLATYFEEVEKRAPAEVEEGEEMTPSSGASSRAFPSLSGDFFPYSDVYVNGVPNYWTGYFTTRPFYKEVNRQLQAWLRSAEILYSLVRHKERGLLGSTVSEILDREYGQLADARQNLALFQHHDGITGTSRDDVMEDYGRRMAHSTGKMMDLSALCLQLLGAPNLRTSIGMNKPFIFSSIHRPSWSSLLQKRVLRVPAGSGGLKLVLFNSHLQARTEPVSLLVEDPFVKVIDSESGTQLEVQINPVFDGPTLSSNTFELTFIASLPPLTMKNYKVLTSGEDIRHKVAIERNNGDGANNATNGAFTFQSSSLYFLENSALRLEFNKASGLLERLHFKDTNVTEEVELSFATYHSKATESGAYLFKPTVNLPTTLFGSTRPRITLTRGKTSSAILVNYTDISYTAKLYNSPGSAIGSAIELKVWVDLKDKSAFNDREVVLQLRTSIRNVAQVEDKTVRAFYVDSNGFTMLRRSFTPETGVEGNYYPMTTAIFIEDATRRATLLSSSSHGATSPADGVLEVMLDRRILEDDKRGLSQGITDNLPVELTFWLVFEHSSQLEGSSNQENLGKLSPLSDALLLQLSYPSLVMYSYKRNSELPLKPGTRFFVDQTLISPGLLCDSLLLNLRTLPQANAFSLPSNSSLLLLHNRASSSPSSKWTSKLNAHCDTSSSSASVLGSRQGPLHLFNGLKVSSLSSASLTGLHSLQRLDSLSQLVVAPFEIASYNVTFA